MTNGKRFFFDISFYAARVAKDRVFISPGIRPGKFTTRKGLCESLPFAFIHLKKEHIRMLQTGCREAHSWIWWIFSKNWLKCGILRALDTDWSIYQNCEVPKNNCFLIKKKKKWRRKKFLKTCGSSKWRGDTQPQHLCEFSAPAAVLDPQLPLASSRRQEVGH